MALKNYRKHGADRIPANQLAEVKHLLAADDTIAAAQLLDSLCVTHKLKSYEAHQLAAHLMKAVGHVIPQ